MGFSHRLPTLGETEPRITPTSGSPSSGLCLPLTLTSSVIFLGTSPACPTIPPAPSADSPARRLVASSLPPRPLHPAPHSSPPSLPLPLLLAFVPPSLAPFPRHWWPARPSPGIGGCSLPGCLHRAWSRRRGRSARPLKGPGQAGDLQGPG